MIEFKASMKVLTGAGSASESLALSKPKDLYNEQFVLRDNSTQAPLAGAPYRIEDSAGEVVAQGITDEQGRTVRATFAKPEKLKVHWGH